MLHIEELYIQPDATVLEAMKKLDETGQRILFVAPEGRLEAVLTDGDVRKYILRAGALEGPVSGAANYRPISLPVSERGSAKAVLEENGYDTAQITVAVVSNDFHLCRAEILARREGLAPTGVGAPIPWPHLEINYYIREAFALAKTYVL